MKKNLLVVLAAGLCVSAGAAVGARLEPETKGAAPEAVKEVPGQKGKPAGKPAGEKVKDGGKEAGKDGAEEGVKIETDRAVLIEAGAEPRRVLRYAPKAGGEGVTMISTIRQTFVKGPENMPVMPGLEMVFVGSIEKAEATEGGDKGAGGGAGAAAGQFVFRRTVQDVRVMAADANNPMAAAVAGMSNQMKGQMRTMTVDPFGRVTAMQRAGADGKPLPGSGDRTGLLSERMMAILPGEAVGVGAKWKMVQTQDVGGSRTPVEVEIVVTKMSETGFEGDVKMTRLAGQEAPPTAGVKIESLSGTGKIKVDLKQPHASEGMMEIDLQGTMTSRRSAEGQKIELKIETQTKRGE